MKKLFIFILVLLCLNKPVNAFDLTVPNNKFGIHLAQPHHSDLKKIAEMLNSNGGKWGYVTLVIQDNDRNREKWQQIFDLLREYHLIPIIRIATHPEGDSWKRPAKEEADSWADFLNSLQWVVKNRYVILFNEPNHGSEWGGSVDAEDYAKVALEYAKKLKDKNKDFFIMLAAMDASAPNGLPNYQDEESFLKVVIESSNFSDSVTRDTFPLRGSAIIPPSASRGTLSLVTPEKLTSASKQASPLSLNNEVIELSSNIFDFVDGLASHSYPNPAFSGSPNATGRSSIRSYEWELELFKSLGVKKKLPVFITETGWSDSNLSRETIASYFQTAYESLWLDDERVVAVTPFVFDYQGEPFLNFSWKIYQSEEYYPQFYTIQSLKKTKGEPVQIDTGFMKVSFPRQMVASSNYHFTIKVKNEGQAIWDAKDGYMIKMTGIEGKPFEYVVSDLKKIKPFEEVNIDLYIKTNSGLGKQKTKLVLEHEGKTVLETAEWQFEILPLPSLEFKTQLYPKLVSEGNNFELQVFDDKEGIVFKKRGLKLKAGKGYMEEIQNIFPGKQYRVVLLNPFYLPRQTFVTFQKGKNTAKFKRMYPFDLNLNGRVDWGDFFALFNKPEHVRLFFP